VIPMVAKSDTFAAFKTFKSYAEKQTGKPLKRLRENKGGEYMSKEFDTYLKECGIAREHSVRNRPQQNRVAERCNRVLGEMITAMLSESGLSKAYWAECLSALVHVLDRCPTSALKGAKKHVHCSDCLHTLMLHSSRYDWTLSVCLPNSQM
jgi:transposase InsO family protein